MAQPLQIGSMMPMPQRPGETSLSPTASSSCSPAQTPGVRSCLIRYRTPENFLVLFNPSKQFEYTQDLERVYYGECPNIGVIAKAFGPNTAVSWLVAQIRDLSEYAGVRDRLDFDQARRLAEVIAGEWPWLKAAELMLFFRRFKSGAYGRFYGTVDPLVVTDSLRAFIAERSAEMAKIWDAGEPERQRRAKGERDAYEKRLLRALEPWNMTPFEFFTIDRPLGLTIEDVEEIGWLFRLWV